MTAIIRVKPNTGACVHADVCGVTAEWLDRKSGTFYCLLHLPADAPDKNANAQQFTDHLRDLRAAGLCDFRWMTAPPTIHAVSFERERFTKTADFRFTAFPRIHLSHATLDAGLLVDGGTTRAVIMQHTTVAGPITLQTPLEELDVSSATIGGDVTIDSPAQVRCLASRAAFSGTVAIHCNTLHATLDQATFERSLVIRGYLPAQYLGLHGTTFHGPVDFSTCRITGVLQFTQALFKDSATLLLEDCHGMDGLIVDSRERLPREIVLSGIHIGGHTRISAALGTRPPMVIAERPPRLQPQVTFSNFSWVGQLLHSCCSRGGERRWMAGGRAPSFGQP